MSVEVQLRRFNSMERRPRMLKEFLSENNSNSSSSSGFKSFPRKPNDMPLSSLIEMELKSRSRRNSTPLRTLVNTIKSISLFTAVKKSHSPMLLLPRSLSRKLSSSSSSSRSRRRNQTFCKGGNSEIKVSTVKIKDIIRWKSFRDLVDDQHHHLPPLSPPPPPPPLPALDFHHCTVGSTTCSSSGSSWCDSDFTSASASASASGYLSSWEPQNDKVQGGNKFSFSPLAVGKHSVARPTGTAAYTAKEVLTCQEDEQQSPVSVLQVGEDEFSPFDQSLANIQRRKQKFMETVQRFESLANLDQSLSFDENSGYEEGDEDNDNHDEEEDWIEERATQLLHCVKASGSLKSSEDDLDILLLEFFREKLSGRRNQILNDDEFEREILRIAEDWINGSFAYDIELVNKDTYIKDMDRNGRWSKFGEEQEELAMEIETTILHSLVADLFDLDR